MNKQSIGILAACLLLGPGVDGAEPQLGGPMKHLLVTLQGGTININFESGDPSEVMELRGYEETYAGAAGVLDGAMYNGQYGWLAGGFINLPPDTGIWVELLAQTNGIEIYEQGSFDPIFTTNGADALWRWNGTMIHNWYTAEEPGAYEATYMVYVGDSIGAPDPLFGAGLVTIRWMIPEPPCVADINSDGVVDTADLGLLIGAFGGVDPIADLNSDGTVDTADLGLLIGEFGSDCPAG